MKRLLIRLFFSLPIIVFLCFICVLFLRVGKQGGYETKFLSLRVSSDPKSFNPILAKETSTTAVTGFMFLGLLKKDISTSDMAPELAEKWQALDNGKRYRFYLRPGLKWSDGAPLTSDDVVFTFKEVIYNKDIPNSASQIFLVNGRKIDVVKVDGLTVDFLLPDVFAPFLDSMSQGILPKHILEPLVKKGVFNSSWGLSSNPKEIVCNGPYALERYIPGQYVLLKANPFYYKKGLPKIKEVRLNIIRNDDVALLKFLDNELDILSIRPCDYFFIKRLSRKVGFDIIKLGPAGGSSFLAFNQNAHSPIAPYKRRWFKDTRFRRALAHLIDKKGIIDTVFCSFGVIQTGPMTERDGFFFNPNVPVYDYSIEKAKSILSEMGFRDGNGDGILEDNNGHPLEFSLITNSNAQERVRIGAIVASDFEKAGIKVYFSPIDFNNLVSRLTSSFDWEVVLIGLTGGMEPHFGANVWMSGGDLHLWNPNQVKPTEEYEKEIDNIFSSAVKVLDKNKRKKLYDRWQYIVADRAVLVYMPTALSMYAVRDRVKGIKPSPVFGILHNIDEIYLE